MKMIPQGRFVAASTGAWVAAWALMAGPAAAQPAEAPAAKPSASDGWKQKAGQGAATDDPAKPSGAQPDAAAAATKKAPTAPAAKSDTVKGASPAERRAFTTGSGDRSLAAEKAAIDGVTTKTSVDEILARALPVRSDRAGDWLAGAEPLHHCGEPRWIEPCIPLPPCHPSHPPHPYDLVGVSGDPTCGPIYRGPCCPRTGTHDDGPLPRLHRVNDRLFDAFYQTK